ncbi:MAG: DnaJ domain-containing protein [Pseudohongiellaceae bacterium]
MFTRLLFAALLIAGIILLMKRLRGAPKSVAGEPRTPAMSRSEALQVLGLPEGASLEEVQQAHRRLLQKLHPDHGGSDYLAQRINAARDRLSGS